MARQPPPRQQLYTRCRATCRSAMSPHERARKRYDADAAFANARRQRRRQRTHTRRAAAPQVICLRHATGEMLTQTSQRQTFAATARLFSRYATIISSAARTSAHFRESAAKPIAMSCCSRRHATPPVTPLFSQVEGCGADTLLTTPCSRVSAQPVHVTPLTPRPLTAPAAASNARSRVLPSPTPCHAHEAARQRGAEKWREAAACEVLCAGAAAAADAAASR